MNGVYKTTYVTGSRGMSQMSLILILINRFKKDHEFLCFILFENSKNCPYLCNQMSDSNRVLDQKVALLVHK